MMAPRFGGDLLPDEILASLPDLYATETDADPMVSVKLFTPDAGWTWWVLEASRRDVEGIVETDDEDDVILLRLVQGQETELGYVSLRELASYRSGFGLGIERDLHWRPKRLSEIRDSLA